MNDIILLLPFVLLSSSLWTKNEKNTLKNPQTTLKGNRGLTSAETEDVQEGVLLEI